MILMWPSSRFNLEPFLHIKAQTELEQFGHHCFGGYMLELQGWWTYDDGEDWTQQMVEVFLEPFHLSRCQMLASLYNFFHVLSTILLLPIRYHKSTLYFVIGSEVTVSSVYISEAMLSFPVCISKPSWFPEWVCSYPLCEPELSMPYTALEVSLPLIHADEPQQPSPDAPLPLSDLCTRPHFQHVPVFF